MLVGNPWQGRQAIFSKGSLSSKTSALFLHPAPLMTVGKLVSKCCSEPDGVQVVPPFNFRFAFIEGFGSEHDADWTKRLRDKRA